MRAWLVVLSALTACKHADSARPPDPAIEGSAAGRGVDQGELLLSQVQLPPGFRIAPYATGVKNARSMALSPHGTLFVGTKEAGNVYAIPNADGDGAGDRLVTVATGLQNPNGVVFADGALFVAERSRILRYDAIEAHLDAPPAPVVVYDGFPTDEHHGWKFMALGPDGKLYVPVGAPCNVCEPERDVYASITRLNRDGSGFEIVARGVRNSVGFDWQPQTNDLWFTENGRDRMGDDVPPDELNRLTVGAHYGFPYCHAGTVADPELGAKKACAELTPPVRVLAPHVAALGMRFYTGAMFPAEYKGRIFVAEHGSWNRTPKLGYRVMAITVEGDQAPRYEVFAQGWLAHDRAWGRPVDVQVMPDGALLVSDDEADAIYRISYQKEEP